MKNNDSNNHIIEIDGTFYQKVNKDVKAGKIVNGKRDGEWIKYHKNGEVASKTNYVNGVLHGESWGWYDNKKLRHNSVYKNGKFDEYSSYYHKNGQLAYKFKYKDCIQHGT